MNQIRGEAAAQRLSQIANRQGGTITVEQFQAAVRLAGTAYDAIQDSRNKQGGGRDHREARLRDSIVQLARLQGWACYWTWRSDHSPAGFPDLELTRFAPFPRIIKAELKDEANKPTAEQIEWLDCYLQVGSPVEVYLWRPSDLDAIVEILKPEWKCNADPGMFGLWAIRREPFTVRSVPTQASSVR